MQPDQIPTDTDQAPLAPQPQPANVIEPVNPVPTVFVSDDIPATQSAKISEYVGLALVVLLLLAFVLDFTGIAKLVLGIAAVVALFLIFKDLIMAKKSYTAEKVEVQQISTKAPKSTTRKVVEGTAMVIGVSILLVMSLPLLGIMLIVFIIAINGGQSA